MMQSGGAQGLNLGTLLGAKRTIKGATSGLPGSLTALFNFSKTGQPIGSGQFSSIVHRLRGEPGNSGQKANPLGGKVGQLVVEMSNLLVNSTVLAGRQGGVATNQSSPVSNVAILQPDASKVVPQASGANAGQNKGQLTTVKSKHHADSSAIASKSTVTGQVNPAVELATNSTVAAPVIASGDAVVGQAKSIQTAAKDGIKDIAKPEPGSSNDLQVASKQNGVSAVAVVNASAGNIPESKATHTGTDVNSLNIVKPAKQAVPGKIEAPHDVKMSGEPPQAEAAGNNVKVPNATVGTITETLKPHQITTNQMSSGDQSQLVKAVPDQSNGDIQPVMFSSKGYGLAKAQPATNAANAQPAVSVAKVQPAVDAANAQPAVSVAKVQPAVDAANAQPAVSVAKVQPAVDAANVQPVVDAGGKLVQSKASPLEAKATDLKIPVGQNATNQVNTKPSGEIAAPKVQITPFGRGEIAAKMAQSMISKQTSQAPPAVTLRSIAQGAVGQAIKSGHISGKQAPENVVPSVNSSNVQKVVHQATGKSTLSPAVLQNQGIAAASADQATVSRAQIGPDSTMPATASTITSLEHGPAVRITPDVRVQTPQVALRTPESQTPALKKDTPNVASQTMGRVTSLGLEGVKSTGQAKTVQLQPNQINMPPKAADQFKVVDVSSSGARPANGADGVVNVANSGISTGLGATNTSLVMPTAGRSTANKMNRRQPSSIKQTSAVKGKINIKSRNKAIYSVIDDKTTGNSTNALNGSSRQTAGDSVASNNSQVPRVADMGPESVITDSFKVDTSNGYSLPIAQQLGLSETFLPTLPSRPGLPDLPGGVADMARFAVWQYGRLVRGNSNSEGFGFHAGSLGNIKIKFSEDEAGIHMQIIVNSKEAQRLVQDSMPRVEQEFTFQGMKFAGINVEVGNSGTGRASQGDTGPRPNLTKPSDEHEVSTAKADESMKDYGYNTVEFVA